MTFEFPGFLRCQTCVSRNSRCLVKKESWSCSECSSELDCLFTRTIKRPTQNTKRHFTWEELSNETPLQRTTGPESHVIQSGLGLLEHENIFSPLLNIQVRNEANCIDPDLFDSPVEDSFNRPWLS